jgi:hypothetical protein
MSGDGKIAFALGGLAGNNAFGAGFLEAALDCGVQPDMISCTSGQLLWVSRYLQRLSGGKQTLREQLTEDIASLDAYKNYDLDYIALALWGKKDVYQPAGLAYVADLMRNGTETFNRILNEKKRTFILRRLLQILPCRLLTPDFSDEFYETVSRTMNDASIGIIFNSYSPSEGCEYVHLNEAARARLTQSSTDPKRFQARQPSSYRDRTIYEDITPAAVRDALWLYFYGFDENASPRIDGAYFRDIILSELAPAHKMYVIRPMHYHWSGDLPRNWPEMEDLKTKVSFNGSYAGERCQILLINHLLKSEKIAHPEKYHQIDLIEIEMEKPRGFFGYVFEDISVFDDGASKAKQSLSAEAVT